MTAGALRPCDGVFCGVLLCSVFTSVSSPDHLGKEVRNDWQRWPWLTASELAEFFFVLQVTDDLTLGGMVEEGSWFHQRLCELQRLGHGSKKQRQAFQALRRQIAKGIQQSGDDYVADDDDVEALLQVLAELS